MAEKHKSLPTSKLVLVSARGFSKNACAKADSPAIDAYSLEEAGEADWKGLIGNGARPSFDLFAFRILRCGLVFVEDNAHEYAASPHVRILNDDGTCIGTLNDVVRTNTDGSDRFPEKAIQYARDGGESFFGAELLIQPEHGSPKGAMSVRNPDTGKAHIVNIRFTPDQKNLVFVADPVHGGLEDDAAQHQGGGYSPPAARSSKPTP
jgi:hypothetical protein